ncbi:AAA family ATPase [uncultured Sutterella sp.]|uniref:AAA family ATPase n=1 Tax=uncultured Sutterella sp. TaxID=286133 RepID=UPI0026196B5E|nr:AAA family ATPase [uncultured Sutterella sp.]
MEEIHQNALFHMERSGFSEVGKFIQIDLDKIKRICTLFPDCRKIFISRQRGFGKSLLVSAFEILFKSGVNEFAGFAIQNLSSDRTFPVVRLDFSLFKNQKIIESFHVAFNSFIASSFSPLGFKFDPTNTSIRFIDQLKVWLSTLNHNSIVVLIDDYDVPLINSLDDPELFAQVSRVMSEFYAAIKEYEGCLRFLFVTGEIRIVFNGIFGGFNILEDITFDPDYGTMLGFTEAEIESNFGDYLKNAEVVLNLSREELLTEMRRHYGGFCFDSEAETQVFCPESVLQFLSHPEKGFQNYWCRNEGERSALWEFIKRQALRSPDIFKKPTSITLDELEGFSSGQDISLKALLVQTGCLTIKSKLNMAEVELGCPNKEVEHFLEELCAEDKLKRGSPMHQ